MQLVFIHIFLIEGILVLKKSSILKKNLRVMKLYSFKTALLSIVFISFLAFSFPEQGNRLLKKIEDRLESYYDMGSPEKAFLETDKDMYVLGDTIWFKSYVVDGITHQISDKSKVVYVEMVDGKNSIVSRRRIFIEGISGIGDINIPKDLESGDYRIRIYTNYMRNDKDIPYFEKTVSITSKRASTVALTSGTVEISDNWQLERAEDIKADVNLMFFPEGGNLVTGLPGVLGIKATDTEGVGQALKGRIHTSDGNFVTEFETAEFGLGVANFVPKKNTTYYALIDSGKSERRFQLPMAMPNGYSLNIKNRGDNILLQVTSTKGKTLDGALLIGHLRGELIFKRLGTTNDQGSYAVRILTEELPDGVAQFTLFSDQGEPLCERLVFVDHPDNDAQVFLNTIKDNFGTKKKVDVDITLLDAKDKPLQGDFSISVFPLAHQLQTGTTDLKSWLLLNSDLGATVSDPGFFFKDGSKRTRLLLDALLLTHGWRRFVWKEMLGDKTPQAIAYVPEKGIMVKGTMTDFYDPSKKKGALAKFNLLEVAVQEEQFANEKGKFSFGPYFFNDSVTAVLQAVDTTKRSKSAQKNIAIAVEEWPNVSNVKVIKENILRRALQSEVEDSLVSMGYPSSYFENGQEVIKLNAVSVKAQKLSRARFVEQALSKIHPYSRPDIRVFRDSIPGWQALSVYDLLQRKGFLTGGGANMMTSADSSRMTSVGPLVLVNGASTSITLGELKIMRANEVVYLDVLRGYNPEATIFGSRAMQGVIAIYTNAPSIEGLEAYESSVEIPGIKTAKIAGFYKAREFYSPNYSESTTLKTGKDYRTTLFWEPKVTITKDGRSHIKFYTGDVTGDFIVKFQGIANDGRVVSGSRYFTVDNSL